MRYAYVLIFSLLLFSCKRSDNSKLNTGFSFIDLRSGTSTIGGVEVAAEHADQRLISLKYKLKGRLFREDTVAYRQRTAFLLPRGLLEMPDNRDIVKVSAVILDTTRTFVFKKVESNYHLSLVESYLDDSTVKVQFVWKNAIEPATFGLSTLDSLSHYYNYAIPFKENMVLRYRYGKERLYYNIIENYGSWQTTADGDDSLKFNYGNIYFDLDLVEKEEELLDQMKKLGWPE